MILYKKTKGIFIDMNVIDRFLNYVSFDTQSNEDSDSCPSTAKQFLLGEFIAEELALMGMSGARIDDDGYVYACLPASEGCENKSSIGFISHMDTAPDASGANIKTARVVYQGGDIFLGDGKEKIAHDVFPFLDKYIGKELIVTDGTTLLGADDKAGIAEIVTAMEYLIAHPEIKHGKICVGFTPDEEIGRGADRFDIKNFGADFAYTVDGGELGEIEYENFNAASVDLKIHGVNIHPGSAKNKMKNAILYANEFINMLPPSEAPAHTEGYEGFFHVNDISGSTSEATVGLIIRDHDRESFDDRKAYIEKAVAYLKGKYGEETFELSIRDSYYNMREKILPVFHIVERAKAAMEKVGVEPLVVPIRGGTDGARLSFEGLPCPNLSTGGANFHGVHEFVAVESMEKMVQVISAIAEA